MEHRQQILDELKASSPLLAGIGAGNPYSLPEGYFGQLATSILEKIGIETALQAASANTYQVPAGYFDGLATAILARVKEGGMVNEVHAELEQVAPLLNTIDKKNPYTIPAGYFQQADFVSAVQAKKKTGKLISLGFARKWTQYAAAAVMTGILVTGAFMFTDTTSDVGYEKYSNIDVSSELNKVSEDELVKYLDNNEHYAITAESTALVTVAEEPADENEPVQVLSDEELNQYLKENAEPAATATKKAL